MTQEPKTRLPQIVPLAHKVNDEYLAAKSVDLEETQEIYDALMGAYDEGNLTAFVAGFIILYDQQIMVKGTELSEAIQHLGVDYLDTVAAAFHEVNAPDELITVIAEQQATAGVMSDGIYDETMQAMCQSSFDECVEIYERNLPAFYEGLAEFMVNMVHPE